MSGAFEVKLISYSRTIRKSINDTWIEWDASLCNDFQSCRIVPRASTDTTGIMPRMCQLQIVCATTNTVFIPHANFSIFRWKKCYVWVVGHFRWMIAHFGPSTFGPLTFNSNPSFLTWTFNFFSFGFITSFFRLVPLILGIDQRRHKLTKIITSLESGVYGPHRTRTWMKKLSKPWCVRRFVDPCLKLSILPFPFFFHYEFFEKWTFSAFYVFGRWLKSHRIAVKPRKVLLSIGGTTWRVIFGNFYNGSYQYTTGLNFECEMSVKESVARDATQIKRP